jgi:hypothetical protein
VRPPQALEGPARVFAQHPWLWALSLAAAASAGRLFAVRACRSRGLRRAAWLLLAASQLVQVFGIWRLGPRRRSTA